MKNISFKKQLLNTLKLLSKIPHIVVIGSEVPNLFYLSKKIDEQLFVSQDVDIGIPLRYVDEIKPYISLLKKYYIQSTDEPSVLIPKSDNYLEINFLGIDYDLSDLDEVYIYETDDLSFVVFGNMSLLEIQKLSVENGINGKIDLLVADPVSLIMEKLLSERNYIKLERDLIVVSLLINIIDFEKNIYRLKKIFNNFDKERKLLILDNITFLDTLLAKSDYPDTFLFNNKKLLRVLKNEFNF